MTTLVMKTRTHVLAGILAAGGLSSAQAAELTGVGPDRAKLIGAWHMVSMEEEGRDGKLTHYADRQAMLVFTADGHFSVQLMYPASEINSPNNSPYSQAGYEASFGSYEVDEATHTVTERLQGSLVRALVGRDLPRLMQFSADGHLTLRSARPDEKWSVTWEHY
jgi:Lipocalin-like domain